jgi:hypothetical protein
MKNPYRTRVNVRDFLNLPGFHAGAYIQAYVEDTSDRGLDEHAGDTYNPRPRILLEIADCSERIDLEFEIYNALNRKNSFHKIDTLIEGLQRFRAGLAAESTEYKRRERALADTQKQTGRCG